MTNAVHRRPAFYDALNGGPATITGVVKVIATPAAGVPVVLMRQQGLQVARAVCSGADGSYTFAHVRAGTQWLVLATDPSATHNAVVADRVQT